MAERSQSCWVDVIELATDSANLIVSGRVLSWTVRGKPIELSSIKLECGREDSTDISDTLDGYQPCLTTPVSFRVEDRRCLLAQRDLHELLALYTFLPGKTL